MERDADSCIKGEDCSSPSAGHKDLKSSALNSTKIDLHPFFCTSSSTRSVPHKFSAQKSNHVSDSSRQMPIDVIFLFNKVLMKSLKDLVQISLELMENPSLVGEFRKSFCCVRSFYKVHSDAEDEIAFPAIEKKSKVQNLTLPCSNDHKMVPEVFESLSQILEKISESHLPSDHARQLQNISKSLQTFLSDHVRSEEMKIWSPCKDLFSMEEQEKIIGSMLGRIRADILRDMIPWLLGSLISEQQQCFLSILRQVTRNTNFDEWLEHSGAVPPMSQDSVEMITGSLSRDILNECDDRPHHTDEGKRMGRLKHFAMSQDELEAEIRRVSRDSSLDIQKKSKMMQNLIMSRWVWTRQKFDSELHSSSNQGDIAGCSPSYRDFAAKTFGCKHYKSNCKLFAPCCNRLYPCRRCHDEVNDHLIDRKSITKMMCMTCLGVQPVGQSCSTASCDNLLMAKYYCRICKIFDDEREIYHCPFCNLCRLGKGLGVDYFHCMNCNACMSRSLTVHICRERCFEDNCPICHEYIFTSSTPVKALRCGHLMHSSCFKDYTCTHYACPICSKSLGDMQVYFEMLDTLLAEEEIPEDYCGITQGILCNDCEKRGKASFHWLYHKCSHCGSYNTRLL